MTSHSWPWTWSTSASPTRGARLQHWYAEFAADPAPASLRHQFVAYRAFERSNVYCMRHARGDEAAVTDVARAQMLLERGETAVLDATWSRSGWREMAAKTATRTHGAFVALRCVADFDVVAARSRSRTGSASDANEDAFRQGRNVPVPVGADAFRQGRNAEGPRSSGAPLG